MGYTEFILTINSSCITILIILAIILLVATRFRGENGYAAAIIVLPNAPVYIYNMSRMLGWHEITLFMFPISYSVNTMLMPLLWLFHSQKFRYGLSLQTDTTATLHSCSRFRYHRTFAVYTRTDG